MTMHGDVLVLSSLNEHACLWHGIQALYIGAVPAIDESDVIFKRWVTPFLPEVPMPISSSIPCAGNNDLVKSMLAE